MPKSDMFQKAMGSVGYKPVDGGYERADTNARDDSFPCIERPRTEFLRLARFIAPQKAAIVDGALRKFMQIKNMPAELREVLNQQDMSANLREVFASSYTPFVEAGKSYLEAVCVVYNGSGEKDSCDQCGETCFNEGMRKWLYFLQLDNGAVPDPNTLDCLLRCRTTQSGVVIAKLNCEYDFFEQTARAIHSACTPSAFSTLRDKSACVFASLQEQLIQDTLPKIGAFIMLPLGAVVSDIAKAQAASQKRRNPYPGSCADELNKN